MSKISVHVGGWSLLTTILLCVFKITNTINIGWVWCFCPLWLPFIIFIGIAFLFLLVFMLVYALSKLFN